MKVTLIWEHGELTRLQSEHALEIALKWLKTHNDLLSVFCTTTQTMYIKEDQRMTVTLYKAQLSLIVDLTAAGFDVYGTTDGTKIFNVDQIRSDSKHLILINVNKKTGRTTTAKISKSAFSYFDCV